MTERIAPISFGKTTNLTTYLIYLRHVAAYEFAKNYTQRKSVLDLGCGTGYGIELLLFQGADQVVGIDLSSSAATRLSDIGNPIVTGNILDLPFPDRMFDAIVSFQVIEHIDDENRYLSEAYRVLTSGGLFLISTPNKALRLLPFQPPFNPYHVREYSHKSLRKALKRQFPQVQLLGLHATPEVMQIEQARLKQDPIQVYSKLFLGKTISMHSRIRRLKRFFFRQQISQFSENNINESADALAFDQRYSTSNFWVSSEALPASLDLIGICRKA